MNRSTMPDTLKVSVVIPVYNEQECVTRLYDSLRCFFDRLQVPYELVFVDDGSEDATFRKLEDLHGTDSRVKVIRFRKNFGQTAAMAAGFEYARGEVIVS